VRKKVREKAREKIGFIQKSMRKSKRSWTIKWNGWWKHKMKKSIERTDEFIGRNWFDLNNMDHSRFTPLESVQHALGNIEDSS
jgi:hypothetical protein